MHSFIFAVDALWPHAAMVAPGARLATRVARAGDWGWPVCRPLRRRQALRRAVGFVPRSSNAAKRDEPSGSWLPTLDARGETRRVRGDRWEARRRSNGDWPACSRVGQPWQVEAAAAVRNLSVLLPLANPACPAALAVLALVWSLATAIKLLPGYRLGTPAKLRLGQHRAAAQQWVPSKGCAAW